LSHVDDFLSGVAADGAEADQMSIHVSAGIAFDRMGLKMLADDQRLNLSQLERAKHSSQTSYTAPIAACLCQGLLDALTLAITLPLIGDGPSLCANVIPRGVGKVGVKTTDQRLRDIGRQLIFEHGYQSILAGEDPLLENAAFQKFFQ